ncbi:MAG: hypothetical protein ACLUFV_03170 [Acutalibacteraceae bacterium]
MCSTQKYVIINAQNAGGAIWHSKKQKKTFCLMTESRKTPSGI